MCERGDATSVGPPLLPLWSFIILFVCRNCSQFSGYICHCHRYTEKTMPFSKSLPSGYTEKFRKLPTVKIGEVAALHCREILQASHGKDWCGGGGHCCGSGEMVWIEWKELAVCDS